MNRQRQQWFNALSSRQFLAGVLFGLFLSVVAVAQSDTLHRLLHSDAAQARHQCAVTMLRSGQVETPVCTAAIIVSHAGLIVEQILESTFVPTVDFSLPSNRGPPAVIS